MRFIVSIMEGPTERDVSSINNIKKDVDRMVPASMPTELVSIIKKWKVVSKSPYSYSFYNITNKSWEDDQDKPFLRVADHWNFTTARDNRIHCKTDVGTKPNHWTLAERNPKNGVYKVIGEWPFLNDEERDLRFQAISKAHSDHQLTQIEQRIKNQEIDPVVWGILEDMYKGGGVVYIRSLVKLLGVYGNGLYLMANAASMDELLSGDQLYTDTKSVGLLSKQKFRKGARILVMRPGLRDILRRYI